MKNLITILLCFIFVNTSWSQCSDIIQGDVNQDSTLNIIDVIWTVNIILDDIEISDEMFDVVDINNDEIINISDIIIIISRILDDIPPNQINI